MIKATLITVGKLKEKYFLDAQDEYIKRLSRYADLKIIEIPPENCPENPSSNEVNSSLKKEAEKIKKSISENSFKIALCIEGKLLKSEEFAEKIKSCSDFAKPLCFVIGSSFGLHESIKEMCDLKLSFSKMTFPHRLFRVMLLEQIYRAFKIIEGGNYHK